jgi:hypothetical protein
MISKYRNNSRQIHQKLRCRSAGLRVAATKPLPQSNYAPAAPHQRRPESQFSEHAASLKIDNFQGLVFTLETAFSVVELKWPRGGPI